jgi:o-succinylbenzoate synthase
LVPALNFSIYRYERPYHQPIQLKQGRFSDRDGLILCLEQQHGTHFAEVAPFPGLQPETPEDCIQQLKQLQKGEELPDMFSSVAWGLHQLQNPYPAQSAYTPLAINTLISGLDTEAFYKRVQTCYTQGYRCFKIKVGLKEISLEIHRIRSILDDYPDITLRLDANRSWSFQEFDTFIASLDLRRIEYFEEPFRDMAEYAKLKLEHWQYIALDESLTSADPHFLLQASAFVIKPMVLGPARLAQVLLWAQRSQKKIVFSACFETSVGLSYLAKYAADYAPKTPCGLDTHQSFRTDIWTPYIQIEQGLLRFDQDFFMAESQHQLKWNTTYIRKID